MGRVYIHELVDVVGTERARYQHHVTANWVPEAARERRQRCFGVWSVVGSTGRWPQVCNLWELDTWSDLAADLEHELAHPGHRDPALARWWEAAASMRSGGTDRILVSHDDSPGVEEWCARGGPGAVAYVHEVLTCSPGTAGPVCDVVVGPAAQEMERLGLGLVGAFRTAMAADDEVVAIWSFADWSDWARSEEAAGTGSLSPYDTAGSALSGRRRVLMVDAELSPLRIARQPTEADRRPLDEV